MVEVIRWAFDFIRDSVEDVVEYLEYGVNRWVMLDEFMDIYGKISDGEELSHNILHTIMFNLERYKLSGEDRLILHSKKMLRVICQEFDTLRLKLIQMGILEILSDIMTREAEKQMSNQTWTKTKESITVLLIISEFFPAIDDPDFFNISSRSNKFLCGGLDKYSNFTEQEIDSSLKIVFPNLIKICQIPHCPTSHKILLLKMINNAIRFSSDVMNIEELLRYTKNLLNTNPINEDNIVIGFAIVKTMYHTHLRWLISEKVNELLKAKKSIVLSWPRDGRFKSFFILFYFMTTYWAREETISNIQIDEQNLIPRIETINSTLNRIMSDVDNEGSSQMSLDINYKNLRELVKGTLNLPDISRHKGKLTASTEGVWNFYDLVRFIVRTVDALIIRSDFLENISDLYDLEDLPVPISPMDIRLELYRSASFNRVLGMSKSPEELRTNPLVRALRLLSILYEVNENWGILFGSLSTERLIDRSCFISELLKEVINRSKDIELNFLKVIPCFLDEFAERYPFLILKEHRQHFFELTVLSTYSWFRDFFPREKLFLIPRKDLFNAFAKILDSEVIQSHEIWAFQFSGELGAVVGSNKEFFSEFSRECQRFSRGLWSGEAGEVVDGVSYVKSQSGLFPLPKSSNNPMAKSYLNAVGMVMAKVLTDGQMLDIHFSDAFYKCLFKKNLDAQQLSLIDIKDVMPSIFKFIESLVDALREKWCIRNDSSLTTEEKDQAISNITCDGCSFEDLCLNFTLPGFPDIEMVEGGSETFLSIENLENYLQLVTWWILYENPQKCMKEVRNGFERIINTEIKQHFYSHEYEELLCGLTKELWTVDILKRNCVLEGLSVETPVVQNLFEVLSSLSAIDQRHFLQFVTATQRFPVGVLAALNPKLTITYRVVDGNPDNFLPMSFTCLNTLFITDYSCKEALEEKLLLAIREGRNVFTFA